eukprot:2782810-Pyramimonas_sp.AAC.1
MRGHITGVEGETRARHQRLSRATLAARSRFGHRVELRREPQRRDSERDARAHQHSETAPERRISIQRRWY